MKIYFFLFSIKLIKFTSSKKYIIYQKNLSKTFPAITHYAFYYWNECNRKKNEWYVLWALAQFDVWIWFLLFFPYLIEQSIYWMKKVKWIFCNLEVVENQSIWGILIIYSTCSRKKLIHEGILYIEWILILSYYRKNVKVSENSVKNILDTQSLLSTNLPNIRGVDIFLYFYATIPGGTVVYTMI